MWGATDNAGAFGDQGGFGSPSGGGFMSSQGGEKQGGRTRVQSLMPVNLAQVATAENEGDKFSLHGSEIHQITVVGKIVSAKEVQTRYDYEMDDRTGVLMDVRQFVEHDESTPEEDRTVMMSVNTYVRVFGHVRAFGGKRSIVAFKLKPVEDMNELTTHLLEVVKAGVYLKKRAEGLTGGSSIKQGDSMDASYTGQQSDSGNPINTQVHALIRGCQEMQGITVQQICSQLRGLPEKAIREAVEFLSSEGHIYSTVDDDHFKTTD